MGICIVQVTPENSELLRCCIQSHHSNAGRYYSWIQYILPTNAIYSWYCQCRSDARTLGSYGHVAIVIWYLSCARLQNFELFCGRRRIVQSIEYT